MSSYKEQGVGGGTFSQPTVKFCRSHSVPHLWDLFGEQPSTRLPKGCLPHAASGPQPFVPRNEPPGFRFLAPPCASKVCCANALGIGASWQR